jgi:uncharacterized protein HemY
MGELKLTLYIVAAKAELDSRIIGLGDVEKALQYIWDAYELARDSNTKKLLKRAYDAVNNGELWKARQILEKVLGKPSCGLDLEEF